MDKMFTENDKISYNNYYLVLNNSTSEEIDELPIDCINSITPAIDKNGNAGLLISFYDEEFCYDRVISCDSIGWVRIEEFKL